MAYNHLAFQVAPLDDEPNSPDAVTPYVDGESLADLVAEFETTAGFEPAGGYNGIVPVNFTFGPLQTYYLGTNAHQWPGAGSAWLLGCDCGEAGCWSLTADVVATPAQVTWRGFAQDHRPGRDYTAFGPFVFERIAYDRAVAELAELPSA